MTTTSSFAPPDRAPLDASVPPPSPSDDLDRLGSRIVGISARLAAATCRWLLLVAEFDRREGCARWGLASTAQWLTHTCGIAHRTAVDHARVARALMTFPALAAALESGRLSYSHARAISRLARDSETQLVDDLIEVAEHGTVGQLETLVRGLRTVEDIAVGTSAAGEYVRHGFALRTSHWRMSTRLDPERGVLVEQAVAQIAEAEGLCEADALVRIAEIALAALHHREQGPPRALRGHQQTAVTLELTTADIRRCADAGGDQGAASARSPERGPARSHDPAGRERPLARIADGPGLPRRVVERLLCACRVQVAVVNDHRNVLDLGRRKRLVDDRLFHALLIRDRHCAHPGCTSKHKLEAHHVIHWLHGGRTDAVNLVLLCSRHHHAHHDGEFSIHRTGSRRRGDFVFRRADGRVLERHIDPSRSIDRTRRPLETEHTEILDVPIVSKSIGDRLDRAWAVAVLADRRFRATRPETQVSAAA